MIMSRRRLGLAVLLLAAVPVGCASPSPVLYTLDAVPGPVVGRGPKIVVLQDVGLAPYLDRKQIVRSSSNYHIDVESNNWWGETFTAMIGRVLAAELDQRLPGTGVFSESGAVNVTPDATVAVNITRFDVDDSGNLVLIAQIGVTFANSRRADVSSGLSFSVPTATPDVTGQVMAMSRALGELADALAAALAR
jgi:uncharacterized lipoprotein YmbA